MCSPPVCLDCDGGQHPHFEPLFLPILELSVSRIRGSARLPPCRSLTISNGPVPAKNPRQDRKSSYRPKQAYQRASFDCTHARMQPVVVIASGPRYQSINRIRWDPLQPFRCLAPPRPMHPTILRHLPPESPSSCCLCPPPRCAVRRPNLGEHVGSLPPNRATRKILSRLHQ